MGGGLTLTVIIKQVSALMLFGVESGSEHIEMWIGDYINILGRVKIASERFSNYIFHRVVENHLAGVIVCLIVVLLLLGRRIGRVYQMKTEGRYSTFICINILKIKIKFR